MSNQTKRRRTKGGYRYFGYPKFFYTDYVETSKDAVLTVFGHPGAFTESTGSEDMKDSKGMPEVSSKEGQKPGDVQGTKPLPDLLFPTDLKH